ncbi:MAG: hypothetical protein WCP20_19100 [Desulfuromonadales bacterium]
MTGQQGPVLEALTRRLAEIPEEFLAEPRIGRQGRIHVAAVVQDLLSQLVKPVPPEQLAAFGGSDAGRDRNRLAIVLILCWLLHDDWFRTARPAAVPLLTLLDKGVAGLAGQVSSRKLLSDPERREELVRLTLAQLGYRPAGESEAQAQDRLISLSSTERARVLKASREAEERARTIREALIKQAAEESADKWTRE